MRQHQTPQAPMITVDRPEGHQWSWDITYRVESSGYPSRVHVHAHRKASGEELHGMAYCDLSIFHDVRRATEEVAVEAMLAACDNTLFGETPERHVVVSTRV